MSSTTLTVRVETDVKKRLEKLAKSTGRSRSFLAAEALNEYLDVNEWQVAGVRKAMDSLDRGERSARTGQGMLIPWAVSASVQLLNDQQNEHRLVAGSDRRPGFAKREAEQSLTNLSHAAFAATR
jgi:RHH-type transcriptional regulator, rel operon repressor / antitoxin RelB